ncbi:MAG: hypothetical protein RMZ41_024375 [Nostoc sp. DedVER02]
MSSAGNVSVSSGQNQGTLYETLALSASRTEFRMTPEFCFDKVDRN